MIVQTQMNSTGSVVITVLVDSLDRVNAPDFRQEATLAVSSSTNRVEVNCESLEFIDSSGLGAFLHVHNSLPEQRRPVRLTHVGTKVMTILELMQVHRIFEVEGRKL
jgi:anti-sigma B factor antagonist